MISVADLVKDQRLPGNYFAFNAYITGDFEAGLLENRRGDRLLALPQTLIQAIYSGIEKETGQAFGLVLANCGRWWGKNFYARFVEQLNEYYNKPLNEMEMVEFIQCLKQCWKSHGWGTFDLDMNYYHQGFIVVKIWNSAFAKQAPKVNKPVCFFETGILSSFFSQLTGRELQCLQTTCESLGADCNHFVLGLAQRLKPAEAWIQEALEHETIMNQLCSNQTNT